MDVMGTFTEHIEGAQKIFKSNAEDLSEVHTSLLLKCDTMSHVTSLFCLTFTFSISVGHMT